MRRGLVVGVVLILAAGACGSESSSYSAADRRELAAMCVDSGIAPAAGLRLEESCDQLAESFIDQADDADCTGRMDLLRSTMTSFLGSLQAGDPFAAESTMRDRIAKCAVGP